MQCCESLDESRTWAHGLTPKSNHTEEGFVTWMLRQAGAGALRIPLDWPSRRLEHWGEKLNLYSYRDMKYSTDAINAFAGVLQRFETIYPKGFFFGVPVEDFDWALTWRSQVPPTRREEFPSWSWAGWIGPLFFGQPVDIEKTRRIPTDIDIRASRSGQLEQIFSSKGDIPNSTSGVRFIILEDPVHKATQWEPQGLEFNMDKCPTAEKDGYLFMTATCLSFKPDFSKPLSGTHAVGQNETFSFKVKGVRCLIRIFSMDRYIPGLWTGEHWIIDPNKATEATFILLARDHIQGLILHQLMLVNIQESSGLAERVTVMELLVPLDQLEVLEEFKPRRQRVVLA
jgi:hypothetical protein